MATLCVKNVSLSIILLSVFFLYQILVLMYVHDNMYIYIVNAVLMSAQSFSKNSIQENLQVMLETQDYCCLYINKGRVIKVNLSKVCDAQSEVWKSFFKKLYVLNKLFLKFQRTPFQMKYLFCLIYLSERVESQEIIIFFI